ncbi:uncharacterized protein LOC134461123 [Engraulis encrasicolus]|uniref:uncharacterized protein LOC134461123 n=1 Tax=Engraulis encrasicolus TaxID=184585 RepID=UPI002FD54D12
MKKGSEGPPGPDPDPDPSGPSDVSRPGSAPGPSQEEPSLSDLQEYILNLSEEEWMAFASIFHTPMTRTHFLHICKAILRVVSFSSITMVLPAYVCMAKDAEMTFSRPSSATSSASSSEITPKRPGSQMFLKLKSALGRLQKSVAWHKISRSADSPSLCPMVAEHGSESHDLTCMAKTLERLLSSDNIDNIAKGLVDQIQAVRQDRSPTPPTLDGKRTPACETQKTPPQKTLSATQVVYSFTEQAIKGLLQPFLLPLVQWNAGCDVATSRFSVSGIESTPAVKSFLGQEKPDCSCLVARLMQALPSVAHQQTTDSSKIVTSTSSTEVANVFSQLMTSQVIDMIDSEMAKYLEQNKELTSDEARILSTTPDKHEPALGERLASSPDSQGGLMSRLLKRFLSEFKSTDSSELVAIDVVKASASTSEKTQSASARLEDVLGLFTSVMVHKVLELLDADLEVKQGGGLDLAKDVLDMDMRPQSSSSFPLSSTTAPSMPHSGSTIPDIYKYVTARNKEFISTACKLPGDTDDNGCLITALVLRLLTKMQDQQTAPAEAKTDTQKLLERLLLEFTNASGTLDFSMYQSNAKLQALYHTLNTLLLRNFGSQAILQRPVDAKDSTFDDLLKSALSKELRKWDAEVMAATSAPGAPSVPAATSSTAATSAPGAQPSPEPQAGTTDSKTRKRWLSFKLPKRLGKKKVSPSDAVLPDTNQSNNVDEVVPVKTRRERSMFIRLFTCCFKGSGES